MFNKMSLVKTGNKYLALSSNTRLTTFYYIHKKAVYSVTKMKSSIPPRKKFAELFKPNEISRRTQPKGKRMGRILEWAAQAVSAPKVPRVSVS